MQGNWQGPVLPWIEIFLVAEFPPLVEIPAYTETEVKALRQQRFHLDLTVWIKAFGPEAVVDPAHSPEAASGQALLILYESQKGPFPLNGTSSRACLKGWSEALTSAFQRTSPPFNTFPPKNFQTPMASNCPKWTHTRYPVASEILLQCSSLRGKAFCLIK